MERYRQRLSGPLLDRIDIRIEVPRISGAQFLGAHELAATSGAGAVEAEDAAGQVRRARDWRLQRSGCLSARLDAAQIERCCALPRGAARLLARCAGRMALSGRGIHRLLLLARTIADLAGSEQIERSHLSEAVLLRSPLARSHCASVTM